MLSISDNIKLKAIKVEDQPKLMELLEFIYPPAYKHLWLNQDCNFYLKKFYSIENLKLELSDPDAAYYFVVYNSNVVGIFRIVYNKPFEDFPKNQSAYINRIYLSEEAQGKGIAKQLFNWVENKAKLKGNTLIWLKAMDSQKQALRFYEKQAYNYGTSTSLDFELIHPHLRGMHTMYKFLT
ncbi:PaiA [Flavobacteriales bacterium ALC-1]|nr:PaiA [Flavobacteriales bacterium ALC-1]